MHIVPLDRSLGQGLSRVIIFLFNFISPVSTNSGISYSKFIKILPSEKNELREVFYKTVFLLLSIISQTISRPSPDPPSGKKDLYPSTKKLDSS